MAASTMESLPKSLTWNRICTCADGVMKSETMNDCSNHPPLACGCPGPSVSTLTQLTPSAVMSVVIVSSTLAFTSFEYQR